MDRIQHYVIFVVLMSSSAHKCKQQSMFPLFDFQNYQIEGFSVPTYTRPDSHRRVPHISSERVRYEPLRAPVPVEPVEKANDRPIRRNDRKNDRRNDRMNERSLAVSSEVQKVQDQEKRRLQSQSRVQEPSPRYENGSYKIVNMYPLTYPSVANRRGQLETRKPSSGSDSVLFPGPTSQDSEEMVVPEECQKFGICRNVPNYPTELVDRLLKQQHLKGMYHVEEPATPTISHRFGEPNEERLCNVKEEQFYPQQAQDRNNKWQWIVNTEKNPIQAYVVEKCQSEGRPCNLANFPSGYNATCSQRFVYKRMLAVDKDNNQIIDDIFKIPTCCICIAHLNQFK